MTSALQKLILAMSLTGICSATQAQQQNENSAAPVHETLRYSVSGLSEPAKIVVDRWGVPHIYANDHYDTFLVQGFNAARDRLWQIDTWRRRGLGELSSVFGEQYLAQDRATRLFLYRGDMYREWLAYGSDAKRIAAAFTAGINAYLDLLEENPSLLPPEFELLGYQPARWQAEDVVRIRGHGLWGNVSREVRRAQIVCAAGLEVASYWQTLQPKWTTKVPDGLDPCVVPDGVLENYFLAKAPVRFDDASAALQDSIASSADRSLGSNNWVVAPERTATGRPILADDPHRTHAVPSLRYIAHLVGPGLDVIGAGEPALPGISIGHNERIAFGLTIFPIDQEDLYVYRKAGDGYVYDGKDTEFSVVRERIAVRGGDAVGVELRYTKHGPVVHETDDHVFVVRAAWLEPGMAPYFGSVEYMRAENWREFLAALNRWGAPSENQVFADTDGNIGYKPAGLFPRRQGWDGLLPVPGDGRYEWQGFFDMDVLPVEYNPERGFTGTANSMNLPDDYPIEKYPMGFEWNSGWRYQRLWDTLSQQDNHTLADSSMLQRDYVSLLALATIEKLPADIDSADAMLLRNWDGNMRADSAAAALYAVWYYRHLQPALAELLLPTNPTLLAGMDSLGVLRLMEERRSRDAARQSLINAGIEIRDILGEDANHWRWGALHRMKFVHPLQHIANNELAMEMRYPDYARGGSGNTTNNTGFRASDLLVRAGASYRQVIDVGNWDNSTMTNAPGQSGDPRSPFYDNLLEDWANDRDFPLLYSPEAVQSNRAITIELEPR